MNVCRRTVGPTVNNVFSRVLTRTNASRRRHCSGTAASARRSRTPAAEEAAERPRRRAIDLALKVRQEKAAPRAAEPPPSGQQRRVWELRRFSTQLQNVHPNVLAKHLFRSLLYRDKHVVVINKPYGVPVRGDRPPAAPLHAYLYFDLHQL